MHEAAARKNMNAYIQANTNGRLHSADEPAISPLNRGYLYGDAIYEVWRTYDGVTFAWDEHCCRLEHSAHALYLKLPFSSEQMFGEIMKTAAAFRAQVPAADELYIRVQVTRGTGQIGLDTALAGETEFTILVQENKLFSPEKFAAGLSLSFADLRRNPPEALNPAWKTGNYLNNILCLREARSRGADEVVITNLAGEIAEAAVSNIAFVRDGAVITPPLSVGILAGITRGILIRDVAPAVGVKVVEESIRLADLSAMQECFLLSSTKDLTPVSQIDGQKFQMSPDSVTLRLKKAFQEYARRYAILHPSLKL
jgi:branched-chain amino acid aminotransferase